MGLLDEIFEAAERLDATDIHLRVGKPPCFRTLGELKPCNSLPVLQSKDVMNLCYSIMNSSQRKTFEERGTVDFAFFWNGRRYRANIFRSMGFPAAAIRRMKIEPPSIESLGLPEQFVELVNLKGGLILVTGSTGSGKSTTVASFVNEVAKRRRCHILTIEDPVEYVYKTDTAVVTQREVGTDVVDFHDALKFALREDPDVLVIGETRDRETARVALEAAETGHLVLTTLHTRSVLESIPRIVDIFPAQMRDQARTQLSFCLEAVITQQLLPSKDGGLVLACEFMRVTTPVRQLIRQNKIEQIPGILQASSRRDYISMDDSLYLLVKEGRISPEIAVERAREPSRLMALISRRGLV